MLGWPETQDGGIVGLLDVGTAKVSCVIVATGGRRNTSAPGAGPRLIGIAQQRASGIKAGVVFSPDEAEIAVRKAVAHAERMAGVQLQSVISTVSCGRLALHQFRARADLPSGKVDREALAKLTGAARDFAERDGRLMVHLARPDYLLDNQPHAAPPLSHPGRQLAGDFRAISADDGPVEMLGNIIERCLLSLDALLPSPLASAMAVTTTEERRLGVTAIDLGAGCTHIASLEDDRLVDLAVLPTGGGHVTSDIALAFDMPGAAAERTKILHGSLAAAMSDAGTTFDYPLKGGDDGEIGTATRAELISVIAPRLERQLDMVRSRLGSGPSSTQNPVVLTGGGSAMPGLAQFAAERLGRRTRIAVPVPLHGMPDGVATGALAATLGLAAWLRDGMPMAEAWQEGNGPQSYFQKLEQWVRESF